VIRELVVVILLLGLSSGCANPVNQATSDRYSQACLDAQRNNQLSTAEQACYRALVNVDWGNLGETQKSQKMYNLARVKRSLQKFDEAEKLYWESLAIEEKQAQPSNEKIGRRLAELSLVYAQQNKFDEGLAFVQRLRPLADTYQGNEKKTMAAIFYVYSQELPQSVSSEIKNELEKKAVEMGFDPKTYKK